MVGRQKVISSPHRRPISPAGPEHLDEHHRRCGTRLHEQDGPQVSGSIASKWKETRPRGSDRRAAEHARLLFRRREGGGRQCCRPLSPLHDPRHGSLRPAGADGARHHRGRLRPADRARKMGRGQRCAGQRARNQDGQGRQRPVDATAMCVSPKSDVSGSGRHQARRQLSLRVAVERRKMPSPRTQVAIALFS